MGVRDLSVSTLVSLQKTKPIGRVMKFYQCCLSCDTEWYDPADLVDDHNDNLDEFTDIYPPLVVTRVEQVTACPACGEKFYIEVDDPEQVQAARDLVESLRAATRVDPD